MVRCEGPPPASATFSTKREAKAWGTKLEDDINRGKHFGYSRVRTLADAIDAFEKTSGEAITTADDRSRHLQWWRDHFGTRKLFHFNADVVDDGRQALEAENIEANANKPARHRSPQTVRHYLMSACMDYTRRKKPWIGSNPIYPTLMRRPFRPFRFAGCRTRKAGVYSLHVTSQAIPS